MPNFPYRCRHDRTPRAPLRPPTVTTAPAPELTIAGFKITSPGYGVQVNTGAIVTINGKMEYGACATAHLYSTTFGGLLLLLLSLLAARLAVPTDRLLAAVFAKAVLAIGHEAELLDVPTPHHHILEADERDERLLWPPSPR